MLLGQRPGMDIGQPIKRIEVTPADDPALPFAEPAAEPATPVAPGEPAAPEPVHQAMPRR